MRIPPIVVFALAALCLVACNRAKVTEPPFTEAQEKRLRELLREEIAASKVPPGTVATDTQKIRDEVDKLILARVREEVPKVDWKDKLQDPKVLELLTGEADGKKKDPYDIQDLNGIPTLKGKIEKAVAGLKGVNSYRSNSALSKQLQSLGPGAKEALWEVIQQREMYHNGAGAFVINEALSAMLTLDDKELLIKDLKSDTPRLMEVAQKLHLEEAGPIALERLKETAGNPKASLDYRLILMALETDQEAAAPLVLQQLANGRHGAHLAQQIDKLYPEIDLTATLREAATRGPDRYDSQEYAELMLKRGMPEGLALAAESLRKTDDHGGIFQNSSELRSTVRRYLNVEGSDAEVAQWILDNRAKLVWDPQTQVFEFKEK